MLDWMIQSRCLAQGDGEEWINILFIVVVAVFWAIGGLVKAAGAKKDAPQKRSEDRKAPSDRQKQETWQQRLARKAEEFQRAAEERVRKIEEQARSHAQSGERPDHRPPDQGRVTVRSGRGGEPVLVYERQRKDGQESSEQRQQRAARLRQARQTAARRQEAQLRRATPSRQVGLPQTEPGLGSVRPVSLGTPEGPRPLKIDESMPQQPVESAYATSSLIDHSDTDALRRAILHYEILGRPLSLRDPFERMSGF